MFGKIVTKRALITAFAVVALGASGLAQVKSGDVTIGSTYSFTPRNFEGQVDISIHLPDNYYESTDSYPVLYLLDTEKDFLFGSAVANFLASNDRIPPLVVVDVFLGNAAGTPPQLMAFLQNQVFPFVESEARVQPCRVLYGHSARSFAALFVLLYRPDLFYGYIGAGLGLTSPPWTTAVDFIKTSETRFAEMKSLKKSLYFVLGNEQPFLTGARKFTDVLKTKAPKDLDWKYDNLMDEDHFSNKLRTLYFGLEHVFKGWTLPIEVAKAGPEAVKARYAQLSDRLGYDVGLPKMPIHRALMNWLAYQYQVDTGLALVKGLKEKYAFDCGVTEADYTFAASFAVNGARVDDAENIFKALCQAFPASPAGFGGLAEVYQSTGRTDLALTSAEKAVELAKARNDPSLQSYQDILAGIKKPK